MRTSSVMKPTKITACISPGRKSPVRSRDWPMPIFSRRSVRSPSRSKRLSGASAATIASLRHAITPNAAKPATISNEMKRGLIVRPAVRE